MYKKIVCDMLCGTSCLWPKSANSSDFLSFTQSQGVLLLLSDYIELIEEHWPKSVYQSVVIAQTAGINLLEQRRVVIQKLFEELNRYEVRAALFKGAANAYLLYSKSILRQHADIDILINERDYSAVVVILIEMGFEVEPIKPTQFGPYQTTATFRQGGAVDVVIDLHWKINNRLLLADTLSVEETMADTLPIEEYDEQVRGLNYHNALLACCIHEAGSLPIEREKLIGLYDAYLLMTKLGELGITDVLDKALTKNISAICTDYLTKSMDLFGDDEQKKMLNNVISDLPENSVEPSSGLLKPQRTWLEEQKLDWLGVTGVSNKIQYVVSKIAKKLGSK